MVLAPSEEPPVSPHGQTNHHLLVYAPAERCALAPRNQLRVLPSSRWPFEYGYKSISHAVENVSDGKKQILLSNAVHCTAQTFEALWRRVTHAELLETCSTHVTLSTLQCTPQDQVELTA
jgi:hypothetical protein